MATSGSKTVTVTSWDTLKFSWSESSQSIANNTTTINWTLQLIATSSGRIGSTAPKQWSVTVNGTTYSGTNTIGISNNSTKTLASGSTTISHNSDGTKTFSYSFSQQFAITFSGTSIGTKSGSGTGTLDTIPRKSALSVGNGTLGTAQTLMVTKQSTGFTHTITYTCGSASGTICTKSSSTSVSFTPPISLSSQNTTGTSVSVKYTITTYSGSTSVGSNSYTKTCTIPTSVKPSCKLTVTDSTNYTNIYGSPVKGLSKFKIEVTPTLAYNSQIASYKTTANNTTYTASSFTTGVLKSSGEMTISATVTDKRGRTSSVSSVKKTIINYSQPSISRLSVKRCNEDGSDNDQGNFIQVTFNSNVSSINNQNIATYTLNYKKTSESSFTTVGLDNYNVTSDMEIKNYTVTSGTYIIPADSGSSYNIELTVEDAHNATKQATTASTAFTLIHFNNSGDGIGIGKIAEEPGVLDIGLQTRFYGGIKNVLLAAETDLNEVKIPNTYIGENVSENHYANCPISSGTFTLEVASSGNDGQVRQRIQTCSKEASYTYERFYYSSSWGDWMCIADFVTEEGTVYGRIQTSTTSWADIRFSYRKWQRGIIEAWCAPSFSMSVNTAYGNGYYNGSVLKIDFPPNMFVGTPIANMLVYTNDAQIYSVNVAEISNKDISFYISSMSKQDASSQKCVNVSLYGYWK